MADLNSMTVSDIINVTEQLHADLLTATAAEDHQIVHASIIAALEGIFECVRILASTIVKIEVEGVTTDLP